MVASIWKCPTGLGSDALFPFPNVPETLVKSKESKDLTLLPSYSLAIAWPDQAELANNL